MLQPIAVHVHVYHYYYCYYSNGLNDLKLRYGICAQDIYKYLLKLAPSQSLRSWTSSATNQAKIPAIVLQDYAKKVPD